MPLPNIRNQRALQQCLKLYPLQQRLPNRYFHSRAVRWNIGTVPVQKSITNALYDSASRFRCFRRNRQTRQMSSLITLPWPEHLTDGTSRPSWSEEWKTLGLGAKLIATCNETNRQHSFPPNLFFVQVGFGIDQHGDSSIAATKASVRAVRNAIEFNSIPGVIEHIPGGRSEMLIHVKLGIPPIACSAVNDESNDNNRSPSPLVNVLEVAKVFPYGKLLPIQVSLGGGLEFPTGRVVNELGDTDDIGVCVVACVTIGYDDKDDGDRGTHDLPYKTYSTKDGY